MVMMSVLWHSKGKKHHGSNVHSSRRRFNYKCAKKAIFEDYLLADALYGSEFKLIFCISRTQFQDIVDKVMIEPELTFYQDKCKRQGKTSCCLEGMLLYPLKMIAFGIPYSTFINNFQISNQFSMKLCREFNSSILALYIREYLRVPDKID